MKSILKKCDKRLFSNFQKACMEFNENWKKLRGLWKAEKLYPRPELAFKPIFDLLSINIESKK